MSRGSIISSGPGLSVGSFELVSAASLERRTVRVTFSDDVLAVNPASANDALNPSNWTVSPVAPVPNNDPIIAWVTTLTVLRVLSIKGNSKAVDVVVDDDFSFDVQWNVAVGTNVESVFGFSIGGVSSLEFAPFDPYCRSKPMPKVFDWMGTAAKRLDATGDAERFAAVLQDCFEQVKFLADCMQELFVPERTPEGFLDARLEGLGNPFEQFTNEMSLVEKRRVALELVNIYRKKGTNAGIESAILEILGINSHVISINEKVWLLENDALAFGGRYTLGASVFPSVDPPPSPGVPLEPLDEYLPQNDQWMGTARLNAQEPLYIHSFLGSVDEPEADDRYLTIRLDGRWNLFGDSMQTYPLSPDAFVDNGDPLIEEAGRKDLHSYFIAVERALTPVEISRITVIAKYMQPAGKHLRLIRTPEAAYNPVVLGISKLDHDWILHS